MTVEAQARGGSRPVRDDQVPAAQPHELLHALKAAQHLAECLELAGMDAEAALARGLRRRVWMRMSRP